MPQEASKTPSDGSKTSQEASKRPPSPSKIDFSSQHGPPEPQKTIKIYWKNSSSESLHLLSIRSLIYSTLMPTWLHFRVQFPPRCLQAAFKTPLNAPAWRPRRPRSHPRGAQDAPRAAQELPQSRPGSDPQAPWGEDTPQGSPRLPPDLDFGPFRRRFVRILEGFWMDFGWIFRKTQWTDPPPRLRVGRS